MALQLVRGVLILVSMVALYGSFLAPIGVAQLQYFSLTTGFGLATTFGFVAILWFEWSRSSDSSYWRRVLSVLGPCIFWWAASFVVSRTLAPHRGEGEVLFAISRSILGGSASSSLHLLTELVALAILFPITHKLLRPTFDELEDQRGRPWVSFLTILVAVLLMEGVASVLAVRAAHVGPLGAPAIVIPLIPVLIATWLDRNWDTPASFRRTLGVGSCVLSMALVGVRLFTSPWPFLALQMFVTMTMAIALVIAMIAFAQFARKSIVTDFVARLGENWLFAVMVWPLVDWILWSEKLDRVLGFFEAHELWRIVSAIGITIGLALAAPWVKSVVRSATKAFSNPFAA